MQRIFLDFNSTTPLLLPVVEAMLPFFTDGFANPSSSHRPGRLAHKAVEDAREAVALALDAHADEVIFTSGATEANNLALFGLSGEDERRLRSIFRSRLHPHEPDRTPLRDRTGSAACGSGWKIRYLPVDSAGIVCWPADVLSTSSGQPCLVSVMLANHETGAIQPVEAIAAAVQGRALFHCDAAAAVGKIPVSFRRLGVDALSLSAHKFHGPKGIGALLVRRGVKLHPLFFGGHQQQGLRPGTEPVPLVVGFAKALEIAVHSLEQNDTRMRQLRQLLLDQLQILAAPMVVNGPKEGMPHTVNVSFPGCRADALLIALDLAGISCSTGSACSSGSLLPSPVLQAMGLESELLTSAMRFSLGPQLTEEDVTEAANRISNTVHRLRQLAAE